MPFSGPKSAKSADLSPGLSLPRQICMLCCSRPVKANHKREPGSGKHIYLKKRDKI